jgi:hypothetical protein
VSPRARLAVVALGLALGVACSTDAPAPSKPNPEAWVPPARGEVENPMPASEGRPEVVLRFRGVGSLHRRYVGEAAAAVDLQALLAPCVAGPVALTVDYEEPIRHGRMVLDIPVESLRCGAVAEGDSLALGEVPRLGAALATVQRELAASRDIRFFAFDLGLHVRDVLGGATVWFTGSDPADGKQVGRCVGVDGTLWCDASVAERAGTERFKVPNRVAAVRARKLLVPASATPGG